jgi:hypothetical protein
MELTRYQNISKDIQVSENNILPYMLNLVEYMHNSGIKLIPYPKIIISSDTAYQNNPFGKTAYYDPSQKLIKIYVAGRHIKDVLRSIAHELIHHNQSITGMFDSSHLNALHDPQYAEKDDHLRKMEEDAYLRGNMCFRAWEDQYKR